MEKHDHFFTPDHIDEQIEQPIGSWPATPEARLLSEVQHVAQQIRAEDGRSLQRVAVRLRQHSMTRAVDQQETQRWPSSSQKIPQGNFNHMKQTSSSKFGRRVSLLVAMLVMALLVGSLLLVLNVTHSLTTTSAPTPTPISQGPRSAHEGDVIDTLRMKDDFFFTFAWSPDSRRVATGLTGHVQIWDATTKHSLDLPDNDRLFSLAWSPNGRYLALSGSMVQIIDPNTGALVHKFFNSVSLTRPSPGSYLSEMTSFSGGGTPIESTAWSPDGSLMASVIGMNVVVWNPNTGAVIYTFRGQSNKGGANSLAWSPDGKYIASTNPHDTIQVWNAHTGQVIFNHPLSDNSDPFASVAWAHHGMTLAFISDPHNIEVWNVATNTKITSYSTPQAGLFAWSSDDSEMASINGSNVDIWDTDTSRVLYRFTKQGNAVRALAWSPDGKYIVSSDATEHSTEAKIWLA
jgi:WD40 repeat protein